MFIGINYFFYFVKDRYFNSLSWIILILETRIKYTAQYIVQYIEFYFLLVVPDQTNGGG